MTPYKELDSFLLEKSLYNSIQELTDEELGQLMRNVFEYACNFTAPELGDRTLRILFIRIKENIDRSRERWQRVHEKTRPNVIKGERLPKPDENEGE